MGNVSVSVGTDSRIAHQRQLRKVAELRALSQGLVVRDVEEDATKNHVKIAVREVEVLAVHQNTLPISRVHSDALVFSTRTGKPDTHDSSLETEWEEGRV